MSTESCAPRRHGLQGATAGIVTAFTHTTTKETT
jgi:hypothetical protein